MVHSKIIFYLLQDGYSPEGLGEQTRRHLPQTGITILTRRKHYIPISGPFGPLGMSDMDGFWFHIAVWLLGLFETWPYYP